MPIDRLTVVLERGTVEVKVLFFGDILGIATGTCIREGSWSRVTELTESKWAAGGWREPTHRR